MRRLVDIAPSEKSKNETKKDEFSKYDYGEMSLTSSM
jgi:hypothetical protein